MAKGRVEAEVKARVDDPEVARERLIEHGAEHQATVEQADVYFDHPSRSFADTDEALRVREQGERALLTYKGPKLDASTKSRRELETGLDDAAATRAMLEALGFTPQPTVSKRREVFALDEVTATLDRVEGLGTFVELERLVDPDELDAAREQLLDLAEELGFDRLERASYLELVAEARSAGAG